MQFYSFTVTGMLDEETATGIRTSVIIFLTVFHNFTEVGMLGEITATGIRPSVTIFQNVNKLSACMFVLVLVGAASGPAEVYRRGHKCLPNHIAAVAGYSKQTNQRGVVLKIYFCFCLVSLRRSIQDKSVLFKRVFNLISFSFQPMHSFSLWMMINMSR